MRLCYIANPNSVHVRRWVSHFRDRGHEIHLISMRPLSSPLLPRISLHEARAPRIPKLRTLAVGGAVRRLVRQIRPDLVHAHQVSPDGWQAAMAGYHPLILTAWGSDLLLAPHAGRRYRPLIRWALRQADHVACVSETLAQAARALGADPMRVEVAPWGVDTGTFCPAPASAELRRRLELAPGPVVLSIRAMRPIYRPLDFAHAIPHVLERVPAAQFVIRTYAYDAALLARFREEVERCGASAAVHYVGDLADDRAIAELYRLADVAVSVPVSDGAPMSVLEAMACGAAVVVSDLPALREWVRDGDEALIVPVGDSAALGEAIARVLADEPLRHRLREGGFGLIQRRGDSGVWLAHAEAVYERLVRDAGR